MPKLVDREQRRQRIADAVCRLIARDGLEEVSLRRVAAEAEVSMGQVQHYFATKDDLLVFAFDTVSARVETRLAATASRIGVAPSTRATLRALLVAMLPADDDSRFEAPLWIAFLSRALAKPQLADHLRRGEPSTVTDHAAELLRSAQLAGEVTSTIDPRTEALSLFALADGLMIRTLLEPHQLPGALAAIDYHLDRIFTHHTSRHRGSRYSG